jgi:hypothetical protein
MFVVGYDDWHVTDGYVFVTVGQIVSIRLLRHRTVSDFLYCLARRFRVRLGGERS